MDNVIAEKQTRRQISLNDPNIKVHVSDLGNVDKKRILENFVENDDALGILLDFISNQYMGKDN